MALNWSKLPAELRYLVPVAEKYGNIQFDEDIHRFMDTITEEQKLELHVVNERWANDEAAINEFLDSYSMTSHDEARLVYFLGHLAALLCDLGII